MNGHEHLIKMRMAGHAPEYIFINDFPCKTDWHVFNDHVTISVHGDAVKPLDLRFLVGMQVIVHSQDTRRAKELFNTCKAHKAKLVYASSNDWNEEWQLIKY